VKARNKLDGRLYAIKKVKLDAQQQSLAKMVREVTTLSRLNHQLLIP
jgi:translation initiation factor 2-alpha kinase 4